MISKVLGRVANFSLQKTMIFGLILGFIYFQVFFDSGAKLESQISAVEANIKQEEKKATEADEALKEVERVRATVGALSEQFKTVSQALPSEVQMSDIIRTVDTVSRASGVSIKSKEPRPVINKEYYEEIPLKITMEGSYSEVTLFLFYLASTERIMKVENFNISTPNQGDKVSQGRLLFEGQVVSYRFIPSSNNKAAGAH